MMSIQIFREYFKNDNIFLPPAFATWGTSNIKVTLDGKQVGELDFNLGTLVKYDEELTNKYGTKAFYSEPRKIVMVEKKVNAKRDHELEITISTNLGGNVEKSMKFSRKFLYNQTQVDEKWAEVDGNSTFGNGNRFYIYDLYEQYTANPSNNWFAMGEFILNWKK